METFNDTPRRLGRAGGDVEMKSISPARQAGKMRSADFQSAVSQIYNLRGTDMPASRTILAPAERNSAIQQITNVRYISSRHAAYTLIEALVYMSMLFVVMALGYTAMYRSMDASTGLRRNAVDITRTLNAGERWREDVRRATAPLRVERVSERETLLHIPYKKLEVTYRFASGAVSRRAGPPEWSVVLQPVRNSTFISDPRQNVTAWKWEIELQPPRKSLTRLHPLFTFLAVPTNAPAK
jgi:hypothetical protein